VNLLFRQNRKLCLLKKQKKTSGTLYSVFKEPGPGLGPGCAVPPAQSLDNCLPEAEISVYGLFLARSNEILSARPIEERNGDRETGLGKS
jgi:hypothetical protein